MATTMPDVTVDRLPRKAEAPAKADLRKEGIRKEVVEQWKKALGRAIEHTRRIACLSQTEFAGAVGRDVRTVRAWEAGDERPHWDAIFAADGLRYPALQALSVVAKAKVRIVVELERSA